MVLFQQLIEVNISIMLKMEGVQHLLDVFHGF